MSEPLPARAARPIFGAFCALAGAALWGASNPFAKRILDQGVSYLEAAGLLYVGAALGLALVRLSRRALVVPRPTERVVRTDLKWLAGAALVGGAVAPVLMMYGIKHTSGLATALLIAVEPPATALIAVAMFGERMTRRLLVGGLLVVIGMIVVSLNPGEGGAAGTTTLGALAVATACTLWALDSNLSARVAHLDSTFVAMLKGALAGPLVLVLAALLRGAPFWHFWTAAQLWQMLAAGFIGYGLGLALMVRAFRELGAARTGTLFASTSLFAALGSVIVLGERPTPFLFIAAAVLAAGVATIVTEKH